MINHIKNISNLFISKIIPALAILLMTRQLYLTLDSNEFESFSFISALSISISSLTVGWVCQSNLRFLGHKDREAESINKILLFFLIVGYVISIISIIIFSFESKNVLLIPLLLSVSINRIVLSVYQSKIKTMNVLIQEAYRAIVLFIFSFILIFYKFNNLKISILVLSLSFSLPSLVAYVKDYSYKVSVSKDTVWKYIRYGAPMSLWLAISTGFPTVERYLLLKISPEYLNDYFASYELIVRGAGLLFTPLMMYIHPLLMTAYDRSIKSFDLILYKSLATLGLFSFVVVIFYYFFSMEITSLMLPGVHESISENAYLLLIIPAFWQACFLVHKKLEAQGKTFVLSIIIIFCLIIFSILVYTLVPIYGVWVSVYAQLMALSLYILMVCVCLKRMGNE